MLHVAARKDLAADEFDPTGWLSEGDDPYFLISFLPIRKRYVTMRLTSLDGDDLHPRLYMNKGRGFREKDSAPIGAGKDFFIVADVGAFGTICTLRLDPADRPGRFSLKVDSFGSKGNLERSVTAQTTDAVQVAHFRGLPRFWRKLPTLRKRRNTQQTAEVYMKQASLLAAELHVSVTDSGAPWLSLVAPVYNAPARYLDDLVKSVLDQKIPGVELVLSDDGSTSKETLDWFSAKRNDPKIVCVLNDQNQGIALATNSGLAAARGEWVALIDHDDLVAPHGLKIIRKAIEDNRGANFLYTDELVVDDHLKPTGVMLKPAYDPVLLSGVNYINHFSIYRRQRLQQIKLLREGLDGSQDYDLLLRYLEDLDESTIIHVPYPAYWWRRNGQTYSRKFIDKATANARRAISERFERAGQPNEVEEALTSTLHRVRFPSVSTPRPKISIIIPNRNSPDLMRSLLRDLYERTAYPDFEVIVVDNGTTDPATLDLYRDYASRFPTFSFRIEEAPFNFSRAINQGMMRADGEHFLLLNNDIEVIKDDWLQEMVECLSYSNVGIVGAKLLYPDQRIQHAGVIAGFGGLAGHWYSSKPADFGGPMARLHVRNSLTCVTGAVMLITRECANAIGPWDEENFAVAYNDVDYCLRAHKGGFRIVWSPFACLIHHESVSRGSDASGERRKRFEQEQENLRRLHQTQAFWDPACHPGYSREHSTPRLAPFASLPAARRWLTEA